METLIYIFKSTAILSLFYIVYFLLLRNDTLFVAKRYYLLGGIFLALLIPALQFTNTIYIEAPVATPVYFNNLPVPSVINAGAITQEPQSTPIDWWTIMLIIYGTGVIVLGSRLLIQITSLVRLLKKSTANKIVGYYYITTTENISPFSFFNYIIYNPALNAGNELEMILTHEQIHALQRHSIDMIIAQLVAIIHWFNPLSWTYKKEMEANLEFIADSLTIEKIQSKKQYQLTLLKASSTLSSPVLTSSFYQSLIKKRILMLNKKTSNRKNLLKIVVILPLLAFFMQSFNVTENIEYYASIELAPESYIITSETSASEINFIEEKLNDATSTLQVKFIDIERNATGNINQLAIATRFNNKGTFKKNVTYGGEGESIAQVKLNIINEELQFSSVDDSMIMNITKNGVIAQKLEKQNTPRTTPTNNSLLIGDTKAQAISVPKNALLKSTTLTNTMQAIPAQNSNTIKNNVQIAQTGINTSKEKFTFHFTKNTTDADLKAIQKTLKESHNFDFDYKVKRNSDGEITSFSFEYNDNTGNKGSYKVDDSNPISPTIFQSNENGITVGNTARLEKGTQRMQGHAQKMESRREQMEEKREQMEVHRSKMMEQRQEMTERRKEMRENLAETRTELKRQRIANRTDSNISFHNDQPQPLIILNGEVYTGPMNTISPNAIESVSVFKNEKAIELYGSEGANGVVQIKTKDNENVIIITDPLSDTLDKLEKTTSQLSFISSKMMNATGNTAIITKDSTDDELEKIEQSAIQTGSSFSIKRIKRNKNNEITRIKVIIEKDNGDQSIISKNNNGSPIDDIVISM